MGHARSLVRLAADSEQLAGRTASARSGCIGSIDRAPSSEIDHHRNRPSPGPILHRATECIGFCEVRAGATTDPQRAAARPSWPSQIRRQEVPCTPEKRSNRPCTSSLARVSDTTQSVRASDTSSCRYQQSPAQWLQNSEVRPTRFIDRGATARARIKPHSSSFKRFGNQSCNNASSWYSGNNRSRLFVVSVVWGVELVYLIFLFCSVLCAVRHCVRVRVGVRVHGCLCATGGMRW
jgi:hypothetical protein